MTILHVSLTLYYCIMPNRIIIFDDNRDRLDSVSMLLNVAEDLVCVGTYLNTAKALDIVEQTRPDLVLMDIDMPGGDGIEGTKLIRSKYPNLPVIIQTIFDDNSRIFDCLRAGASGYLLKKTTPEKFLQGIREALEGGAPMSGSIASKVLHYFQEAKPVDQYNLTPRELEILSLLVQGNSYKMIAQLCFISYNTVSNHIHKIYEKLYVNSATEAVSFAIKNKIV